MDRSRLATWDGCSQVTAWALALVNAQGDIVGFRSFGEPLPTDVFYDGICAADGVAVADDLYARIAKTPLANAMWLVLALINRGAAVSDRIAERAKDHVENVGIHAIAELLDVPTRAAVEQRELGPMQLWAFDSQMRHRLASVAYTTNPPRYIVEATRRFCADWDWNDSARCASGAFSPAPHVLLQITPVAGDGGILAAVNVQHLKARSLSTAITEYSLTEREGDVLKLLLAGFRANEIGETLSIAESTVREHVKHVLVKTGSRNRVQMIARVLGYVPGVRHRLNSSFGMPN
jgi:DNA-binding CsgD family transcriptional regulator